VPALHPAHGQAALKIACTIWSYLVKHEPPRAYACGCGGPVFCWRCPVRGQGRCVCQGEVAVDALYAAAHVVELSMHHVMCNAFGSGCACRLQVQCQWVLMPQHQALPVGDAHIPFASGCVFCSVRGRVQQ
jgi:hypothetical protein